MNEIGKEKSPYLRQHEDNPVHWLPWGEKAFEKARRENKPIFLSIGYSTCHWCHVMARECFENLEIAKVLNRGYISIKVDREERPDVDALYMAALLALTGSGGWPLSAWILPDGRPFFAGTYFPPQHFLPLLNKIEQLWKDDHTKLSEDAEKFKAALEFNLLTPVEKHAPSISLLSSFDENFESRFDQQYGGFSGAPKFPQSMSLMTLMRADLTIGATRAREFVHQTLENMSNGELFDHVEGGFHRYSTGADWSVPHFEKMLYDQAWISIALFEASQFLQDQSFCKTAERTLAFVKAQMTSPGGGFYSALDAESVNPATGKKEEGYYYSLKEPALRKNNPKPHRDEKIIASWNGWMIGAFSKGFEVTGNAEWLDIAEQAYSFVGKKLVTSQGIARRLSEGDASIAGTSEDYAAMIFAALALYNATLKGEYLNDATKWQNEMIERFWSEEQSAFLLSSGSDKNLILRFQQESDGVTPTTNALSASNLLRLSFLTSDAEFSKKCEELFERQTTRFAGSPLNLPYFGVALAEYDRLKKVEIENPDALTKDFRQTLREKFYPFVILSGKQAAQESFSVCTRKECLPKVHSPAEVIKQLI